MADITLHLPALEAGSAVEVEVTVRGKTVRYVYRVELVNLDAACSPATVRVECLRKVIREYEPGWQLMAIGAPDERTIPLTFRRAPVEVH